MFIIAWYKYTVSFEETFKKTIPNYSSRTFIIDTITDSRNISGLMTFALVELLPVT
jgi:hypothetical protein